MTKHNILLVDDEATYCQSLRSALQQIGLDRNLHIVVKDCQNWEEAEEELARQYYAAIILDAKCLLDKTQVQEDFNFLPIALNRLQSIEKAQDRHIPFAINTVYAGEKELATLERIVSEKKGKIFAKLSPKDALLNFLLVEIEKAPETKVLKEHKEVFEIFDTHNFMPPNPVNFRYKLLQILKNINNEAHGLSILQDSRVIQDEIYKLLQVKCNIPNGSFLTKNKYLSGEKQGENYNSVVYQTEVLSYLASVVNKASSSFGNHSSSAPTNVEVQYWEQPSQYAVKSVVFALLEQLLWFKKLMQTV